jgi:hypothetical protein
MSAYISVCECFEELYNDELAYHIFIDLVFRYTIKKSPIILNLCDCCKCAPIFKVFYHLENLNFVNILEINHQNLLIVPRGVRLNNSDSEDVYVCICEKK